MAQRLLRRRPFGRRRADAVGAEADSAGGLARAPRRRPNSPTMIARRGTIRRCRSQSAWRWPGAGRAARFMAAMAQQDCGQCGYNCADYANALFLEKEERLTLCAPGGKETARMLKQLAASWRAGAIGATGGRRQPAPRAGSETRSVARQSGRGEVPVPPPPQRRGLGKDHVACRVRSRRRRSRLCRRRQLRRLSRRTSRPRRSGDRRARRRSALATSAARRCATR